MQIKRYGFTLAEVLIVLGIIGIVAEVTIPTVLTSFQKQEYITGLEKAYSVFNQSLSKLASDNNCPGDLQCTGIFSGDTTAVGNAIAPYLKTSEVCGEAAGCFSGSISNAFDGSAGRQNILKNSVSGYYKFRTVDGMNFAITSDANNCTTSASTGATKNMQKSCGTIRVDVNGDMKPNNFGKDIFYFYITNGRGPLLYPYGGKDDATNKPWNDQSNDGVVDAPSAWMCNGANLLGYFCTGRVLEEGWQMNY